MRKKTIYPLLAFVGVFVLHAACSLWKDMQISKQWVQIENTKPLLLYFESQNYLLGISYALAVAFTIYAFLKFLQNRKKGIAGMAGGITLTGVLYFFGCFLLGCCGSPLLPVYLSLFGSSFLGFTKPLTLILTTASVGIGYFWLGKKPKTSKSCCVENEKNRGGIIEVNPIKKMESELQEGMGLAKCKKCGCMKETLENLRASLLSLKIQRFSDLLNNAELWLKQMEPIKYACLGCEYCFPAVAMNIFNQTFPEAAQSQSSICAFEVREKTWPPVVGEYFAFCNGSNCPVAVSTLASVELAEMLASTKQKELCIVGKTETENIGVDKVIKNIITNTTIRFLLLVGSDPKGHQSGKTFLSLWENGVDENMRVIGSPGRRPILRNVRKEEVEAFRKQVQIVDMIGCEDVGRIVDKIKELSLKLNSSCGCNNKSTNNSLPVQISCKPVIQAKEPKKVEMDKAGYFVIMPQREKGIIIVEHYSYDNELLRIIEGKDSRSIYWTIIQNGWVTQLSHAAYLGKELEKAELSIKFGFKYIQDGA